MSGCQDVPITRKGVIARTVAVERVRGIEPPSQAWEAYVLPLNHTRMRRLESSKATPSGPGPHSGPPGRLWGKTEVDSFT